MIKKINNQTSFLKIISSEKLKVLQLIVQETETY